MDEKKGVGAELQSNAHCYITGKKNCHINTKNGL